MKRFKELFQEVLHKDEKRISEHQLAIKEIRQYLKDFFS